MQIGNQRSKPCSSLISAKRAQLLRSPFPLSCDHPTSLGLPVYCRVTPSSRVADWPPGGGAPLALRRRVHPGLTQAVCLRVVSFSSDTLDSNSRCQRERSPQQCRGSAAGGEQKGKKWELGWGRVGGELCGAYVVPSEMGGCWQVTTPPAAPGFSLVQPLPGCTRWLRAISAGPREISGGERGLGAGSRERVRHRGMAECFGAKFPF